ncbi:MAG: nitrite reductase (NAD(P)H) small subunit [Anaerolineae bacterium]|nr:nitrite reductase (NAD(P)H) small subunit [Anaerolineae bacterium]
MTTSLQDLTAPAGYIRVCAVEQIPPRGRKTVYAGDIRVLIVACDDGLHAIEDRCPQTGRSIVRGEVLDGVFTTPTVGARYDLRTGRYLGGGQSPLQSHWLTVFPLRVIEGGVYIRLPG